MDEHSLSSDESTKSGSVHSRPSDYDKFEIVDDGYYDSGEWFDMVLYFPKTVTKFIHTLYSTKKFDLPLRYKLISHRKKRSF